MTKISVVLPFKNAQKTLAKAVKSILDQSFKDFELILINDNSTDNSTAVLAKFKDPRISLIQNRSIGLSSALNTGIKQANGEYIARMDADDISYLNRFQRQLNFAKANPEVDVISCLVDYQSAFSKESNTAGYQFYVEWLNNIITTEDHWVNRFAEAPIAHPTLFCKRTLFKKHGFYTESNIPEDFELWLKWMSQGVKFGKVNEVLYQWLDYSDRLSRTHDNYAEDKFYQLKAEYLNYWFKKNSKVRIWICGYGKDVFRKSTFLETHEMKITGYVDVKKRANAKRRVISYAEVQKNDKDLYLVYVSDRQGKNKIKLLFDKLEMQNGLHYYFMS